MGIRIHKQMGWGLTLTQQEATLFLNDWEKYEHTPTVAEYIEWLQEQRELVKETGEQFWNQDLSLIPADPPAQLLASSLHNVVTIHEDECPEEGKDLIYLCITPVSVSEDWIRWDDSIDYAEVEYNTHFRGLESSMNTEINYLKHNPFPFSPDYMHIETGERFSSEDMESVKIYQEHGFFSEEEEGEIASKSWGTATFAEAQKLFAPFLPEAVRDIAQYMNLFSSEGLNQNVMLRMRPMIITYWN